MLATNHIVSLEKTNQDLQNRIAELEQEVQRLRSLNDKIAASNEGTGTGTAGVFDARPLSPPPDAPRSTSVSKGQESLSKAPSPSASVSTSEPY
jgi:cell division septum initiation protein DivIVA